MDWIKEQVERIRGQLAGLSASQKMLTAALVVIMGMTLIWWARYAGEPEMRPLLNQAMKDDELARITRELRGKGVRYRVAGDRILVPADRLDEALADLGYAQLLPQNTETAFDEISRQMTPWDPLEKNRQMWNLIKERSLARIIRRFPDVADATVMINPAQERRIGAGASIQPSASVMIQMRSGRSPGKQLIAAAADMVAGAQSGLARSRINVVVDGVSHVVRDRDAEGTVAEGTELITQRRAHERDLEEKIQQHLGIPGLRASVTVTVNLRSSTEQERRFDPKNTVHKERSIERETEETSGGGARATAEAGARANVGDSIAEAGGTSGGTQSREREKVEYSTHVGTVERTSRIPAGEATVVAAAVRVPRSHFVAVWKALHGVGKEPEEPQVQQVATAELVRIRSHVKNVVNLKSDESVAVDLYTDALPPPTGSGEVATAGSGLGGLTSVLGGHAKEIAVGGLALLSLFMMLMMVRKSSPSPAVAMAGGGRDAQRAVEHLRGGEDLAGEAAEGQMLLDGMELDEEALRSQQIVAQVSSMVKENPDAAATLVRRWLSRS